MDALVLVQLGPSVVFQLYFKRFHKKWHLPFTKYNNFKILYLYSNVFGQTDNSKYNHNHLNTWGKILCGQRLPIVWCP